MTTPRIVKTEANYGVAFWNNVVVTDVRGHVDSLGVRNLVGAYHQLLEAYPAGIAGITVLRMSLRVGSAGANAEARQGMSALHTKLLHIAIVIEDQGVLAQLLRTIIRTLNSIARSSRLSFSPDLPDAARAIAPHVVTADPSSRQQIQKELLEVVATLGRALPPAEPR